MRRLAVAVFVGVACSFATPSAFADVYGYVDAGGAMHLANEKLDDRYTLFLRGGNGATPARLVHPDDTAIAPDQALTKTRLFQRLVDHPNIAKYEAVIRAAAARHSLDPQLVKAVIAVESGFEPGAVSDKGAVGLMQVLPSTGERYGVHPDAKRTVEAKLHDPVLNLEVGTRYLSDLRKMFANRPELALAAYNAGENTVIRYHNAIPPFPETQAYVKLVDQFHTFYNPTRFRKDATRQTAADLDRIRVMVPARRNLPDPKVPLRLPAPTAPDPGSAAASVDAAGAAASQPAAAVVVPSSPAPAVPVVDAGPR